MNTVRDFFLFIVCSLIKINHFIIKFIKGIQHYKELLKNLQVIGHHENQKRNYLMKILL